MSVTEGPFNVAVAVAREREREQRTLARAHVLAPTELAREIRGAMRPMGGDDPETARAVATLRSMSEHERDAVQSEVALIVGTRHGWNVPRGTVGRKYLALMAAGVWRDSRSVRDSAASFQTRAQRDRDTGPMIVADAGEAAGVLMLAQSERDAASGHGAPDGERVAHADARLAVALADALAEDQPSWSEQDRESVTVALLRSLSLLPLATIARTRGYSLITAKRRSAAGARLLRETLDPAALVGAARAAAHRLTGSTREQSGPTLSREGMIALSLVDAAKQVARERANVSSAPVGPVLARATRRNLRADRITGRTLPVPAPAPVYGSRGPIKVRPVSVAQVSEEREREQRRQRLTWRENGTPNPYSARARMDRVAAARMAV